jgi:hypothetical protein
MLRDNRQHVVQVGNMSCRQATHHARGQRILRMGNVSHMGAMRCTCARWVVHVVDVSCMASPCSDRAGGAVSEKEIGWSGHAPCNPLTVPHRLPISPGSSSSHIEER